MPEVDARLNAHFKDEYILEFLGLVVRLALAKTLAPTHVAAYRTQLPDERLIKQRLRTLPLPSESQQE